MTDRDFSFSSPAPSDWLENNLVRGKIWTAGNQWRKQPTVFLIHGWNGEACYNALFPWLARRFSRMGINAAMLELPYHGHRKPSSPGALTNFISDDLAGLIQATAQALADFAYLEKWARQQGCQRIGLCGFSLGGWLAGLLSSLTKAFDFTVLVTPICRLNRVVQELAFCQPIRQAMEATPFPLEAFDLKSYHPQNGNERTLLIKSEYDLFVPPETIEELWEEWGHPEIWRLSHSHLSVLLSLPTMARIVRWVQGITAEAGAESCRGV